MSSVAVQRLHKALLKLMGEDDDSWTPSPADIDSALTMARVSVWDMEAKGIMVLTPADGVAVHFVQQSAANETLLRATYPFGHLPRMDEMVQLDDHGPARQVLAVIHFPPPPGDPAEPHRCTVVLA